MLRTTLMVGFPGETEEDFDELMDFVKEIKFDRMGAFMFCPEDGTRAAEMPDQIPEEVKQERYDRLMTLQHGVSLAQNKARVGTTCRVLVEKKRGQPLCRPQRIRSAGDGRQHLLRLGGAVRDRLVCEREDHGREGV